MSAYCALAPGHPLHGPYHDTEYGFPVTDDSVLLERLALEIFQAGLSWLIVLKKRPAIFAAFDGFVPETVASYGARDVARLLADPGIIRNRRKIEAIIENARRIGALAEGESGAEGGSRAEGEAQAKSKSKSRGSFAGWLAAKHPREKAEWVKLFRKELVFTGPEVTGEFLMSIGYLPGAHAPDCPVYQEIARQGPPWMGRPARGAAKA